jgi:hypothetical protein
MTGKPKSVRGHHMLTYRCDKEKGGCSNVSTNAPRLDAIVEEMVIQRLASPEFLAAVEKPGADERSDLARQLTRDEALLLELSEMLGGGELSLPEWRAASRPVKQRLDHTRAALAVVPAPVSMSAEPDVLRRMWQEGALDERRTLISIALERLVVKPQGRGQRLGPEHLDAYLKKPGG